MKCENCNNDHDGTYGKGRFCSVKCARGFASKIAQDKNLSGVFTCVFCGVEKPSTNSMNIHSVRCSSNPDRKISKGNTGKVAWNKGKTKETDSTMRQISETLTGRQGTPHSDATKAVLREAAILAHKEGRAWNIGMNRWQKKPSYAEEFFMKVIANDFSDKNFEREVYFKGFVLDFLWEHKKKVIEIDGKQHEEPVQKERDSRKDSLLVQNGYQVMRIKWKDMYNNTSVWVDKAKSFIDS